MDNLTLTQRILIWIIEKIEKRVYKRKWTYREQITFARRNTNDDATWMPHNKVAREVSVRHANMLKDEWWTTPHESQDTFRTSIGLNPHRKDKITLDSLPVNTDAEALFWKYDKESKDDGSQRRAFKRAIYRGIRDNQEELYNKGFIKDYKE